MQLYAHRARIDSVFKLVSKLGYDAELQAHFARYLCVLASGYLEQSVREIYSDHASRTASPRVARAVGRWLEGLQNPKMEQILQVAGAFDLAWRRELEAYVDGERKDAVDSIVANRHLIAHGEWSGVTFLRVSDWWARCHEVVDFIDGQCV